MNTEHRTPNIEHRIAPRAKGPFDVWRSMSGVRCFLAAIFLSLAVPAFAAEPVAINGITEPFLDVTLSVSVAGIISSEFFKEGEPVKQGDVILELDKKMEEVEVQRRTAV